MDFLIPETLAEALDVLATQGDSVHVLAGGSDLMVQLQRQQVASRSLLWLGRVDELRSMSVNGTIRIGATVTHRELGSDERIRQHLPAIALGARTVGGWQTQAVGTIGGNICNASPAADLAAPLLANDAQVVLASASGERTIPYEEFVLGRRETARRPDELVVAVELETPPAGHAQTYYKAGRRRAMEIATAGIAVRLGVDAKGNVDHCRIGAAAVGPRPVRLRASEDAVFGTGLTDEALDAAGKSAEAAISPIDDVRASADYRRRVVRGLVRRAAETCAAASKNT